jgi:hypothetical protein
MKSTLAKLITWFRRLLSVGHQQTPPPPRWQYLRDVDGVPVVGIRLLSRDDLAAMPRREESAGRGWLTRRGARRPR